MDQARYVVKITEVVQEKRLQGSEWKQGADMDADPDEKWGYTPEIEKTVEVTREIFKQDVNELDLKLVIKAINGI